MEEMAPLFAINIFGYKYEVMSSVFIQWVFIALALVLSILYSRKVKKVPGKVQSIVEVGIEFLSNVVKDNMGPGSSPFIPYIGSLGIYLFLLNMVGLFGIKPPTSDFSVSLGIALTTFFVIQGHTIKKLGLWGYFNGEDYASNIIKSKTFWKYLCSNNDYGTSIRSSYRIKFYCSNRITYTVPFLF